MSGVDIIDLIDGAIADWETSDDAMRWTPDPPVEPFVHRFTTSAPVGPRGPSFNLAIFDEAFTIDTELMDLQLENLRAGFRSLTSAVAELLDRLAQHGAGLREAVKQATATLGLVQAIEELDREPATKGAASRVPMYRDRRPRWQTPYGPPARHR